MGQIQSFVEFLDLLRRRRLLIMAVALLGILSVAAYLKARPDTYEAVAVIQIELALVSRADEEPVQSGAAQMLQAIEQRLTTRDNLLTVVDRHGIFADVPALTDDQKANLLRSSVRFETVASAICEPYGVPPQISALLVSARLGSPDLAARVANDFAQSVLDQSSSSQLARARVTTEFFKGEEIRVFDEITALEARIATYQIANAIILPNQIGALRGERIALEDNLRRFDQDQLALDGRRTTIGTGRALRATDQQALADLQAQADVLAAQRAALLTRRNDIDAVLSQSPEVDRALSGYARQLQQLQEQYDVINRRMAEAGTAQLLSERQQAERFTLLERAVTPQFAVAKNQMQMAVVGALASLVAAIALAFLLDLMNPVVRTADQMERQLDLRPVVSIPEVRAAARSNQRATTLLRLVDDPGRPIFGLPRYAVFAGGATLCLMLAAAWVS